MRPGFLSNHNKTEVVYAVITYMGLQDVFLGLKASLNSGDDEENCFFKMRVRVENLHPMEKEYHSLRYEINRRMEVYLSTHWVHPGGVAG